MPSERVRIPSSAEERLEIRPDEVVRLIEHLRDQLTLLDDRERELQAGVADLSERERIVDSAVRELQLHDAAFRREHQAARLAAEAERRGLSERGRELDSRAAELAARVAVLKSLTRRHRLELETSAQAAESLLSARERTLADETASLEQRRLDLERSRESEERAFRERIRRQVEEMETRRTELLALQTELHDERGRLESEAIQLSQRQADFQVAVTEAERSQAARQAESEAFLQRRTAALEHREAAVQAETERLIEFTAALDVRVAEVENREENLDRQAAAAANRAAAIESSLEALATQRREFEAHRESALAALERFNSASLHDHAVRLTELADRETRLGKSAATLEQDRQAAETLAAELLARRSDLEGQLLALERRHAEIAACQTALNVDRERLDADANSLAELRTQLEGDRSELDGRRQEFRTQHDDWEADRLRQGEELSVREQAISALEQELRVRAENWEQHCIAELARRGESLESRNQARLAALDLREQELERREVDQRKRTQLHESHRRRTQEELAASRAELERDRQRLRLWNEQVEASVRLRLGQMRRFRDLVEIREQALSREQEHVEASRRQGVVEAERTRAEWETRLADDAGRLEQQVSLFRELNAKLAAASDSLQQGDHPPSDEAGSVAEQRRALQDWMNDELQRIDAAKQLLADEWERLRRGEHRRESERERWTAERIEAERTIRDLVNQLETALLRMDRLRRTTPHDAQAA